MAEIVKELRDQPDTSVDTAAKSRQSTSGFYRPELDVLRFCAFLMVFFGHLWPQGATAIVIRLGVPLWLIHGFLEAGALGVYIFFMLSSYLITELLLLEKARTGTIHIKSYYVRRTLRIWPLYFLFIGLAALVGLAIPQFHMPGKELAMMLLLSGNWYFIQSGWGLGFVSHLWSISVEEQFYLIWPVLLKLSGVKTLFAGCVALILFGFASVVFLASGGSSANPGVFINSFVICSFFALGGITALMVRRRAPKVKASLRALLVGSGLLMLLTASTFCGIHDSGMVPAGKLFVGYLLALLGCLSIFFGFLGAAVPVWGRSFVYLGKISYGLYVFHLLCGVLTGWFAAKVLHHEHWPLGLPFALLLTVLFAALSYRFVESPFLRLKERFVFVQSRRV